MANGRKRRKGGLIPRWLRHRNLMLGEAILLMGVVQEIIQRYVTSLPMPNWGRVLWIMGSTLGLLGAMLVVVRVLAERGLAKTHDVVQALPLPTPLLLIHALAYGGLFLLYAKVWDLLPLW